MVGDVGVFTHEDNDREMIIMVEYGMSLIQTLISSTSLNVDVFGLQNMIGRLKEGLWAEIIAVKGDPNKTIETFKDVQFVMKDEVVFRNDDVSSK